MCKSFDRKKTLPYEHGSILSRLFNKQILLFPGYFTDFKKINAYRV